MSSDLTAKIDAATSRLLVVQKEYADAEASANAHEQQARADRLRMTDLKRERGELDAALRHSQVQQSVLNSQQLAAQAQAKAEAAQRDAEKSREEQAKMLDELRAQKAEMDKAIEGARAATAAAMTMQAAPVQILEQATTQPAD